MTQPHKKRVVHGALLEYSDAEQIDTKAIAEKPDIIPQVACAYLRNLRSGPNIYQELLRAGYTDQAIPGWVGRGGRVDPSGAG